MGKEDPLKTRKYKAAAVPLFTAAPPNLRDTIVRDSIVRDSAVRDRILSD